MPVLRQILTEIGIERPDGRPLYALPMTVARHEELGKLLQFRIASGEILDSTAARFVLWAAEHIRSRFEGGQLTWDFVFGGLGLRESRGLAVELVKRGLPWWRREVRVSEAGIHLYLYTLMVEGGLPQALLHQKGLYSRVVKGLLSDIETEGADIPDELAYRMASRRNADLPQTFQTEDIARLLADLALALVRLRADTPQDVPLELIDRWLDRHRPDWVQSLPLRLSKEAADSLIRPALQTERNAFAISAPIASRMLKRNDATGEWQPTVRLATEGTLAAGLLPPAAKGLRLRFLPTGNAFHGVGAIVYSASPNEYGWELRRVGGAGAITLPLDLDAPLILAAFADGRSMGEVEVVPPVPLPDEAPSLWRTAEESGYGDLPGELLPLGGTGKTRASQVWLLTTTDAAPVASEGIILAKPHVSVCGRLWPISGNGEIRLGEQQWLVATGADEDLPDTRLMAYGNILPDWRLASNGGHLYLGNPTLYGQRHTGTLWPLPRTKIRTRLARTLMGKIAEWVEQDTVHARLRYVALPEDAETHLRETSAGVLELQVGGFPSGLSLTLQAGQTIARTQLSDGCARLSLAVQGSPPGIVTLRLSSPEQGRALELVCPWPARSGMILGPDNIRLERDMPLSVEALRGWRAVVPKNIQGEVQFHLDGHFHVAMRVEGEMPLAAQIPLIRSMLAHAGPDAQVRLSLITGGQESRRLEIRRYHNQASILNDGRLRLGLPRDAHTFEDMALSQITPQGKAILHAVNLNVPERTAYHEMDVHEDIDLRSLLPEGNTVWLIQSFLNGEIQRATVWSPGPVPFSRREERITKYSAIWTELSESADRTEWNRQWALIRAAATGGDPGILDQVQALARVPQAAIRLVLRVPSGDLSQALALDAAAPIFWPVFPVNAFQAALDAEYSCLFEHYNEILEDEQDAKDDAAAALARRVGAILILHPELAGHFGAALVQTELLPKMPSDFWGKVAVPPSEERLIDLAQEAARRADWLPSGLQGTAAHFHPSGMPNFNSYTQLLIDAPLVTAEITAGLRRYPDPRLMMSLINLRLIDPIYFDAALPIALALALQKVPS